MPRPVALLADLRATSAYLAGLADPHAELLALLWGPRFDREHARSLAAATPRPGEVLSRLLAAADQYDRLPSPRQQRLRQLVLRQRARWDNRRHAAHPAD